MSSLIAKFQSDQELQANLEPAEPADPAKDALFQGSLALGLILRSHQDLKARGKPAAAKASGLSPEAQMARVAAKYPEAQVQSLPEFLLSNTACHCRLHQ